jgi:hypothetical protein
LAYDIKILAQRPSATTPQHNGTRSDRPYTPFEATYFAGKFAQEARDPAKRRAAAAAQEHVEREERRRKDKEERRRKDKEEMDETIRRAKNDRKRREREETARIEKERKERVAEENSRQAADRARAEQNRVANERLRTQRAGEWLAAEGEQQTTKDAEYKKQADAIRAGSLRAEQVAADASKKQEWKDFRSDNCACGSQSKIASLERELEKQRNKTSEWETKYEALLQTKSSTYTAPNSAANSRTYNDAFVDTYDTCNFPPSSPIHFSKTVPSSAPRGFNARAHQPTYSWKPTSFQLPKVFKTRQKMNVPAAETRFTNFCGNCGADVDHEFIGEECPDERL